MKYESYRVKSVKKAIHVLKLFSSKRDTLSLSDISKELNVHKSTAYRIAVTLVEGGLLRWNNSNGTYSLGLGILELSSTLLSSLELRTQARPHMIHLQQETGDTVHLGVLDQGEVIYLDKIEGEKGIRLYSKVGVRAPCHCTALGKALMADLPDSLVRQILKEKGMYAYTGETITSISDFLEHLSIIRANGYAIDVEEHEPLVHCIAVPIRDHTSSTVAAVSNTTIIKRFEEDLLNNYIDLIKETGRNISIEMGFVENNLHEKRIR